MLILRCPKIFFLMFSGHIDHSTKIMHVITWNRSFKNLPDHDDLNDNFEIDDRFDTHAAVLDRMLAWEKKLYDEVKVIYVQIICEDEFWCYCFRNCMCLASFVLHVNTVRWSTFICFGFIHFTLII